MVIVCCNGIGTPRLLQLSSLGAVSRRPRQQLGPGRPQSHDAPLRGGDRQFRRAAGKLARSGRPDDPVDEFDETDASRGFVRGAKWQVMPTGGPLGMRAAYGGKPLEEAWASICTAARARFSGGASNGASSPKICRASKIRWRSIRNSRTPMAFRHQDHIQEFREYSEDDRLSSRSCQGGDAGRGCGRHDCYPADARLRLASDGHLQHGHRSPPLGSRSVGPGA